MNEQDTQQVEPKVEPKEEQKALKKICIVGCSGSKDMAPFKDPSFEIWGVNNLFLSIPKFDRWFEIHHLATDGKNWFRRKLVKHASPHKPGVFEWSNDFRGQNVNEYIGALSKLSCPIYMQQKWDGIPTSEPYPINAVLQRFPRRYFTNTVSFELALAIMMVESGDFAPEIHVYGVDMAVGSEWAYQRPSCEYFLGLIEGMGIKLVIPAEADLLKSRFLYGFQERETGEWEKKIKNIRESMNRKRAAEEQAVELAQRKINQYIGAEQALNEVDKIWG